MREPWTLVVGRGVEEPRAVTSGKFTGFPTHQMVNRSGAMSLVISTGFFDFAQNDFVVGA